MNFTIDKNALQRALALTGRLAGASQVTAARVRVQDGQMTVTATNLAIDITAKAPVAPENAGDSAEFYVDNAKLLMDVTQELPEGDIRISVGTVSLNIDWPSGNCNFPITDMLFPAGLRLGTAPENPIRHIAVPREALLKAFGGAIPFLEEDDFLPLVGSVLFDVDGKGGVTIVGTDRQVLVTYEMQTGNGQEEPFKFMVPKSAAKLLCNIMTKDVENVIIHCDGNVATVSTPEHDMAMRCPEVRYPAYRSAFLAAEGSFMLDLKRTDILCTVRRVGTLSGSKDAKDVLVLDLTEGADEMDVSAWSLVGGTSVRETAACRWNGPDMRIAFNIRKLQELLSGAEGETVTLCIAAPNKGVILVPDDSGTARAMIMPSLVPEEPKPAKKKRGA